MRLQNRIPKLIETKSQHITFILGKKQSPPVFINNVEIPKSTCMKYLGAHLDSNLLWKGRYKKKQTHLKIKNLYQLLGRRFKMTLENVCITTLFSDKTQKTKYEFRQLNCHQQHTNTLIQIQYSVLCTLLIASIKIHGL